MQTMTASEVTQPLVRLKRILVPIDFSVPSQEALEYARGFARCFDGEIVLLHAVPPIGTSYFPEAPIFSGSEEKELEVEEMNLQAVAREGPLDASIRVETLVRRGLPAHEIVEAAREIDADLIVIATHGYTGWKHFCIGSTTERVVRAAPCPVFVLREKEHEFV
jgi:universal stress protein A